jgi:GSH-dependent disulfide-bond oxidoreductase
MLGQNHHFTRYAPERIEYAVNRYVNETNRLYGVLDRRLEGREFIAGDYSIADMACYPWILPEAQGQDIEQFPNLKRWRAAIKARPATQRAYAKGEEVRPAEQAAMTDEQKKVLFGQTARNG